MDRGSRSEQKRFSRELFSTWSQNWGLSLAFAITQSVDESEKVVADAIVALVARKTSARTMAVDDTEAEFEPSDFAATIWELASSKAFRGFGADSFFKLPVLTRAVVMLKLRARFSRSQIADSLDVTVEQVDSHLESARLVHTGGRSWLISPTEQSTEAFSTCPQWERVYSVPQHFVWKANQKSTTQNEKANTDVFAKTEFLQEVFDRYVGNDLDTKTTQALHTHLTDCTTCRNGFVHFRKTYNDWMTTIPVVEPDAELQKHIEGVSKYAAKTLSNEPSPFTAVKAVFRNTQFRAILVFLVLSFLYIYMKQQ